VLAGGALTAYGLYQDYQTGFAGLRGLGTSLWNAATGMATADDWYGVGALGGSLVGGAGGFGATRALASASRTTSMGGALPSQIGRVGEDFLQRTFGGRPASFETSMGRRVVDNFSGGIARESKVGEVSMSPRVRLQVDKELELRQTGQIVDSEWHFFRSPVTGRIGPTSSVERLLKECGIECVYHGE
jgi:filamentous hemagglutinin